MQRNPYIEVNDTTEADRNIVAGFIKKNLKGK